MSQEESQERSQEESQEESQERRLRVRQLLYELRAELAETETLDEETRRLVQKVDKDIDTLIETTEPNSPLLDDAISLSARFAATHPVAERITRELVTVLGRMGI